MRRFRLWVAVGVCGLLAGAACNGLESHECTEIGCGDGVGVNILPVGGIWSAGAYRLELSLDDLSGSCDFSVPEDLPDPRSATSLTCLDGASVWLQQVFECHSVTEGGGVSESCQPIANQYELTLSTFGKPTTLRLVLTRDGEELISENRELSYTESRPNGPDCEPVCQQAQVDLTF
jgi:hypothetical protein